MLAIAEDHGKSDRRGRLSYFPGFVKYVFKATLVLFVAVTCLAGLGLLAVNLYVQSPDTQVRLRQLISRNLGQSISVFRTSFDPWTGVHLQDVVVEDPSNNDPMLRVQDLWIQCDLLPLIRHKLIVRQMTLSGAELRLPMAGHLAPPAETSNLATPEPSFRLNNSNKFEPGENPTPTETERAPRGIENPVPRNFAVEVRNLQIRRGTIYFLGPTGYPAATISELEGAVQSHREAYIGRVHIANASISNSVSLDKISSPIRFSKGTIELKEITGQISGGQIRGSFRADLNDPELPYRVRLQITGVNINEIGGRAGGILDRAHGTLQGSFQLAGSIKDPSLATGSGSLEIKTGYLDQYPMLKELGRWTQIDELQRLDLERADSKFTIIGRDIKVNSLELVSKNCEVNLWGTIDSAQKLDLNGRLTLSQFLSQKIPNELEENFARSPDGQSRYLDFQVTGSVIKPQTDLFDRIIGDKMRFLRKIFRLDHTKGSQKAE
jgi:AsmA-like C-terminal region